MTDAGARAAAPPGRSTERLMLWLAVVVACLAVVGNVVQASRHGWVLESDNAAIAINSFDTVHGHPRLLGVHSSAVAYAGIGDFYHPGPLLYWLAALPAGLFGWGTTGFLAVTALINGLVIVGSAWVGRRRGGDRVAAGLVLTAAVLLWAVGPEVPHDIWNPHIAVLPWFLALLLLWSVLEGDRVALVVLAVVGSFVVQDHFGYVPLLGPLLVVVLAALALVRRSAKTTDEGGSPDESGRWWRAGVLALLLAIVVWLPVIIQQLTGQPKNLSQLARFVANGSPKGRKGLGFAFDRLFGFFGARPIWLDREVTFFTMVRPPSMLDIVLTIVILASAVALTAYHWRRGDRRIARLLSLCLASVALLIVATASLPDEFSSFVAPYNYRPWWPVCALLAATLAWAVLALAPGHRWRALVPGGVVVAVTACTIAVIAATNVRDDHGANAFRAIRAINGQLRATLPGKGPYYVATQGQMAYISLENPVILDLVRHGYDVRTSREREPFLGTFRRVDRRPLAGILLVASGAEARTAPAGSRELLRVNGPARRIPGGVAVDYPAAIFLLPPERLDANGGIRPA